MRDIGIVNFADGKTPYTSAKNIDDFIESPKQGCLFSNGSN